MFRAVPRWRLLTKTVLLLRVPSHLSYRPGGTEWGGTALCAITIRLLGGIVTMVSADHSKTILLLLIYSSTHLPSKIVSKSLPHLAVPPLVTVPSFRWHHECFLWHSADIRAYMWKPVALWTQSTVSLATLQCSHRKGKLSPFLNYPRHVTRRQGNDPDTNDLTPSHHPAIVKPSIISNH